MTAADRSPVPSFFRRDVEGLRGVAVLFVLAHHAGEGLWPGGFIGVDVFFVISGFVVTLALMREVERTGRVDVVANWSRRVKRVLPAATLVLGVTLLAAYFGASQLRWGRICQDVIGAALYVVNWVFAAGSLAHPGEETGSSAVQNYWPLAVGAQAGLLWPLLVMGAVLVAAWLRRRSGSRPDRRLDARLVRAVLTLGLVLLVVLPSLVWSWSYTSSEPTAAYFVTTTRLWELGLGALVAVLAPVWSTVPRRLAVLLGWAGLVALVVCGFALNTSVAWPGAGALWPTLATVAVIVAGCAAGPKGPVRVLGSDLMVGVGALSYSLYLWHWPMLAMAQWRLGALSLPEGLAVVGLSVVPAWLCYRIVERPMRRATGRGCSPRLTLSVGVNVSLVPVLAGLVMWSGATAPPRPAAFVDPADYESAVSSFEDKQTPLFETLTPAPSLAAADVGEIYDRGCVNDPRDEEVQLCLAGDPNGKIVVAAVGDSKVAQWMPALQTIAEDHGWRLEIYLKSGCPLTSAVTLDVSGQPYDTCTDWGREVLARLLADPPELMVTSGAKQVGVDSAGQRTVAVLIAGYIDVWRRLADAGVPVAAISDTPGTRAMRTPDCIAAHVEDPNGACAWSSAGGGGSAALRAAAAEVAEATYVDMNPWVCADGICRAVQRNVVTYRYGSHLTATFAGLLTGQLEEQLVPLVEQAVTR